MGKLTKKGKLISEKVSSEKLYSVTEAVGLLTEFASGNFKESLEVSVNLGIDARKSDQAVRGSTVLPSGTGKEVRVAVFAQGENAEKAKSAGADLVGFDDLAESIQGGNLDFDVVIATPDAMRVVGKLGTVLGPRGLMPNPKVGTVTPDVETAVKNAKGGQVRYRTDKNGIVHGGIGKVGFDATAVQANLEALLLDLKKFKPASSKGVYIRKVVLSSTMGPGLQIDHSALEI
jgi:large subunit ribosomal protein L1